MRTKPKPETRSVVYVGSPSSSCNICGAPIVDNFIDGRTINGWWAEMCAVCHLRYGVGLGTGQGQRFQRQDDGTWLKVEG